TGGLRRAGGRPHPPGARGNLRRRDRRAAGGRGPRRPAAPPPPSRAMSGAWHALADPWMQPIMRHALAEVVLLGVTAGALGCWIVFYNLSYSAESLAHSLLPGLVVAALLGFPLLVGGAAGVLVAGVAVALAGRTPEIGRDNAVAVV